MVHMNLYLTLYLSNMASNKVFENKFELFITGLRENRTV